MKDHEVVGPSLECAGHEGVPPLPRLDLRHRGFSPAFVPRRRVSWLTACSPSLLAEQALVRRRTAPRWSSPPGSVWSRTGRRIRNRTATVADSWLMQAGWPRVAVVLAMAVVRRRDL